MTQFMSDLITLGIQLTLVVNWNNASLKFALPTDFRLQLSTTRLSQPSPPQTIHPQSPKQQKYLKREYA